MRHNYNFIVNIIRWLIILSYQQQAFVFYRRRFSIRYVVSIGYRLGQLLCCDMIMSYFKRIAFSYCLNLIVGFLQSRVKISLSSESNVNMMQIITQKYKTIHKLTRIQVCSLFKGLAFKNISSFQVRISFFQSGLGEKVNPKSLLFFIF